MPETPCRATLCGDSDYAAIQRALQDIGFSGIHIAPVSPSLFDEGCKQKASTCKMVGIEDNAEEEAERWLEYIRGRDDKKLKSLAADGQLQHGVAAFINSQRRYFPCGAGLGLAAVSCSGDIFLCQRFVGNNDYKIGSIFSDGALERDAYLKSPTVPGGRCSECFARYYCAGSCKHDNLGKTGSVFEPPEEICRQAMHITELCAYISCMLDDDDKAFLVEHEIIPRKPCPFDF